MTQPSPGTPVVRDGVRPSERQTKKSFLSLDGATTVWYWEYLPADYAESSHTYPLLVFFHGLGENGPPDGSQLERVRLHGPPKLIQAGHDMAFDTPEGRRCFIVVSPQNGRSWWDGRDTAGMLAHALATYRVDPRRIYVTGLSMGGGAAWRLATGTEPGVTPPRYWASRIAALAPVCGAVPSSSTHAGICSGIVASGLPVWAFHGSDDPTVPLAWSQAWVDKINGSSRADGYACDAVANPPARLTVYAGVGHDSWTRTYDPAHEIEPGRNLYQWLLAQRRC